MKIGIGIPNSIPGTEGKLLLDWARRAEALGFSALSTIGRVVYPSFEELTTLAAAAGATERIGLLTGVLLEPTREPVQLAKSAASLDQLSAGRFILGMAAGGRPAMEPKLPCGWISVCRMFQSWANRTSVP